MSHELPYSAHFVLIQLVGILTPQFTAYQSGQVALVREVYRVSLNRKPAAHPAAEVVKTPGHFRCYERPALRSAAGSLVTGPEQYPT